LHAERDLVKGSKARRELIMKQIANVMYLHPDFNAVQIAAVIDAPIRSVQRYVVSLRMGNALPVAA